MDFGTKEEHKKRLLVRIMFEDLNSPNRVQTIVALVALITFTDMES